MNADVVVVVGAWAGGYTAAFRAADLGLDVVLVERHEGTGETGVSDRVLVAVGRRPKGGTLGPDAAGVHIEERGFVPVGESALAARERAG